MSQTEDNSNETEPQGLEQNCDNVFTTAFMTFVKDHIDLCEDPSKVIKKGESRWRRLPKYRKMEYLVKAVNMRKRRMKMKCKPKGNSCHEELPAYIKCFSSTEDQNIQNQESKEEPDVVDSCMRRRRRKSKQKRRSPCCPRKKVPCKANRRRRRKRSCRR